MLWIETSLPFASDWIFYVALTVPDDTACVQLIVQNASSPAPVTVDSRWAPFSTIWPCNIFLIEPMGDGLRRLAGVIFLENAQDDLCFSFVDASIAARY